MIPWTLVLQHPDRSHPRLGSQVDASANFSSSFHAAGQSSSSGGPRAGMSVGTSWKLSPMDLPSRERWYEYSQARDAMLKATDTKHAPWNIVRSDDKKRARLNVISHILSQFPYEPVKKPKIKLPERSKKHAYDDITAIENRRWIPEKH